MMTIDEAIIHAEEIAEINENIAYNTDSENWMDIAQCEKCAEEHRQLAEWLKELKQYQWIPVSERLPRDNKEVLISCEWGVDIGEHDCDGWRSEWINHYDDDNVLAWMPLPPPWKE